MDLSKMWPSPPRLRVQTHWGVSLRARPVRSSTTAFGSGNMHTAGVERCLSPCTH